jgi:hypothetical protein
MTSRRPSSPVGEEEQRKQRTETLDGSYLLKSSRSDMSVEDIWRTLHPADAG